MSPLTPYPIPVPLTRYTVYQWGMPKRGEVIACRSPRRPDVIVLKHVCHEFWVYQESPSEMIVRILRGARRGRS